MRKAGATRTNIVWSFPNSLFWAVCCMQIWALAPGSQGSNGVAMNIGNQDRNRKIVTSQSSKVQAVNLGGWLVTEGWITRSLFNGIPNKDLLDGTQIQLQSISQGTFLTAENGGGTYLVANRTTASNWETFTLWRINETTFNLKVNNNQFVGVDTDDEGNTSVIAMVDTPGINETFQIVMKSDDGNRVRIQAPNGLFLQVTPGHLVITADSDGGYYDEWDDDDPSVFNMTIVKILQGEYQVTNAYGHEKALMVMQEHWSTFITEDDFKFISENGLNAVRIPVGWWIASDPNPPKPFVGGSLEALDNAFSWAQKYGIKVIIDLHAAPGAQNRFDHSGTRDGSVGWGKTVDNINETVAVIDFLAAKYGTHPNLHAIGLLNEPFEVSFDSLKMYYQWGYAAVRKYSSSVYVIMSDLLDHVDSKELFLLANGWKLIVLDVHYYNLYSDLFTKMNVQQNIDFIYNKRSAELSSITTSDGPLTFVGEWSAKWNVDGTTKEELQRFANAQVEVFGSKASFGWAYWTIKLEDGNDIIQPWSLKWMINNGCIKLTS